LFVLVARWVPAFAGMTEWGRITGFLLALMFAAAVPVLAQETKPYLPAKPAYAILVIGDGIASGMGAGIARMAESDARLSVDGRYEEDSGLARPDNYDWVTSLPRILDTNPFDIVVIQLGSNDSQELRDGNFRFAFGTPDWEQAYQKRIDALVAAARSRSAAIYWVSPPPMAAPDYNAAVARIAGLMKARVQIAGLRYLDIRQTFSAADGSYTDRGQDVTGENRRLRNRDGVHFLRIGNDRFGQIVLAAIKSDIDAAAKAAPLAASQATGPSFGQDGATVIVTPAPGTPSASTAAVPPGGSAAKLFRDGIAPDPQPGRFDDFSLR
jgi:hypothetical protein